MGFGRESRPCGALALDEAREVPQLPKVVLIVQDHILAVEECVARRRPTRLQQTLLSELGGTKNLKMLATVRRSRAISHTDKLALEQAIANQIVKAKTTLGRWQQGLREIEQARRRQNAAVLEELLEHWRFADDEPTVAGACEDLARWKEEEAGQLPSLLEAMEMKDMKRVRAQARRLSAAGAGGEAQAPLEEAQALLRKHQAVARALKDALAAKDGPKIQEALAAWEFGQADRLVESAREALKCREGQLKALRAASRPEEGARLDLELLEAACNAWEFGKGEPAYVTAADTLEKEHKVRSSLGGVSREDKARSCLAAADGWALRRACSADGVLDEDLDWADASMAEEIRALLRRHKEKRERVWAHVSDGSDVAAAALERVVEEWDLAPDDPSLALAQLWLAQRGRAAAGCAAVLRLAVRAGLADLAAGSLSRAAEILGEDAEDVKMAERLCDSQAPALHAVGAAMLGIAPAAVPDVARHATATREVYLSWQSLAALSQAAWDELRACKEPPAGACEAMDICLGLTPGLREAIERTSDVQVLCASLRDAVAGTAVGCGGTVASAREAFAKMKASLPGGWDPEAMSLEAPRLLVAFLGHLFALDEAVSSMRQQRAKEAAAAPSPPPEDSTLLAALREGPPMTSPALAAAWALCGGGHTAVRDTMHLAHSCAAAAKKAHAEVCAPPEGIEQLLKGLEKPISAADARSLPGEAAAWLALGGELGEKEQANQGQPKQLGDALLHIGKGLSRGKAPMEPGAETKTLAGLALAARLAKDAPKKSRLAAQVARLAAMLQEHFVEIAPLQPGAAAALVACKEVLRRANEAAAIAGNLQRFKRDHVEALAKFGWALPAMDVGREQAAAAAGAASLLASPPAASAGPGAWLKWIDELVRQQGSPLAKLGGALSHVAKGLLEQVPPVTDATPPEQLWLCAAAAAV